MRKLLFYICFTVILCSFMMGCSTHSEIEINPGKVFTKGTLTDKCYISDWLDLKYTLTDQMKMDTFDAESSENTSIELYATVKETEDNIGILVEKSSANIDQQIKALQDEFDLRYDTVNFEKITQKTLCNMKFAQIGCMCSIDDVQFYQLILIKKIDDRFVSIITNASTKDTCEKLLDGFSKL